MRYELHVATLGPMTFALVGLAAVVFTALVGVVHTVQERRRRRRTQQQWEERERLLNRQR
jgi:heme/copper-type cytochrome/quinol oxidase subunit 2